MRNLTDEQAQFMAYELVGDILMEGVEYWMIEDTMPEFYTDPDDDVQSEDVDAVDCQVEVILTRLLDFLHNEVAH